MDNSRSTWFGICALMWHGSGLRCGCAVDCQSITAWLLLVGCFSTNAVGEEPFNVFQEVAFDQRLDNQVPPELAFRDHTGRQVQLADYFGDKPIILTLVYYECPMLCTLELNGLVRSLKTLQMSAGEEFTILTVSFDPGETTDMAAAKRKSYLQQYDREQAAAGWHFLTGDEPAIRALCESVGFRYRYDSTRDEYAHASGIVLLTPSGKVARYFYGIDYAAKDLRLGLVESSEGKIGTPVDQLLLLCYGYDPATGKYGFLIMNFIRVAGAATVLLLGGFIGLMIYRERRGRRQSATAAQLADCITS